MKKYPFLIFYAVDDTSDEVAILHVRHCGRNGRNGSGSLETLAYSAAAVRGRPTNPVASPKRSTMTAGRSLALLVTQAPERTV